MNTYIKFIITSFLKSFFYVLSILFALVFILNLLSELEFFKNINIDIFFTLFISALNSPSTIYEMFPFIFLLTTQLFFIKLFTNNEIEIFKYSGLKNSRILVIISFTTVAMSLLIITIFYNFSSNLKNFYLDIKSNYTIDGKYLAVITKNGLWIKDEVENKKLIINSSEIKENYLMNNFITEFDKSYNVKRNIKSNRIDITKKEWLIYDAKIYERNNYYFKKIMKLTTNFDYEGIQSLYSDLSSLNIFELYELRKKFMKLNYSLTEINLQFLKIFTYPIYLLLIVIFSATIMLNTKRVEGKIIKISLGLFFSVIIYYFNNFFIVMGSTERIALTTSIFLPLIILSFINILLMRNINAK